jgi:hypothetical protein
MRAGIKSVDFAQYLRRFLIHFFISLPVGHRQKFERLPFPADGANRAIQSVGEPFANAALVRIIPARSPKRRPPAAFPSAYASEEYGMFFTVSASIDDIFTAFFYGVIIPETG